MKAAFKPEMESYLAKTGKRLVIALSVSILLGVFFPLVTQASNGVTPIAHNVTGQEECLSCHAVYGQNPMPPTHSAYGQNTCLTCHTISTTNDDTTSSTNDETTVSNDSCQQCHNQAGLSMALPGEETLPLYINSQEYAASVHGNMLLCTDCHSDILDYPHPKREISSRREYSSAQYELCINCHYGNYTKALDSIHYKILPNGELRAPLCTDCHGAHAITSPSQPRAHISQMCSQCHPAIYQEYVNSVHGKALLEENNYDVPVCTDCHKSHTIEDPKTASFRLDSVHLCSDCHSNKEMMEKYGISSNVVETYLNDFHGRTVALIEKQSRDIWVEEAVCSDCHGIHDIQAVDSPHSPVIKNNLVVVCSKCHSDVNVNFSDAWLSHYEPSMEKTPLIFIVRWFYWILIPFMLVGLSVHILLDFLRKKKNR
ncbi:cytochrome c3 family protein [Chloroflexota bacterium]